MPPDLSNPWDWIQLIFTALGLSTTAGLRAYLPLLAVALGSTDPSLTHIELTPGFQWMGTQWFMIVIGALALIEFGVDKVPGLDHINDIVHTIIRPASGAIIMAGIVNPISAWNPWVAAVIGGVLALIMHTHQIGHPPGRHRDDRRRRQPAGEHWRRHWRARSRRSWRSSCRSSASSCWRSPY